MKSMITSFEKENFSKKSAFSSSTCFFGSSRKNIIAKTLMSRAITQASIVPDIPTYSKRIAPSAGPTRNQRPNIAPMSHIFFVRFAWEEISDIYACMTPNPAPPSHPINRELRNTREKMVNPSQMLSGIPPAMGSDHTDISMIIKEERLSIDVIESIFFLPCVSESRPK